MNKFVLICCLLGTSTAYAYENCIITSDNPITSVENKTPGIISIQEITTIMNDRNTVIIECLKEGSGEFTITSGGKESKFNIKISANKSEMKGSTGYNWYVLDMAPGVFELDPPPMPKNIKKPLPPKGITGADSLIESEGGES